MGRGLAAVAGALAFAAVACGSAERPAASVPPPTSGDTPTTSTSDSLDRQVAVYAAVLDRYLRRDASIGGPDRTGTVYIVASAGLDQGSAGDSGAPITVEDRRAIASQLGGDYRVRWVSTADKVNLTGRLDCEHAKARDVLVALGEVPAEGRRITLTLDGASDCGLAGGWTYRLVSHADSWTVVKHRASWQT